MDIENTFKYHPPQGDQPKRYSRIRASARDLAYTIVKTCPACSERTLAIRKVQEAFMWAKTSIETNEPEIEK
jgi:hypothetical protein